MTPKDIEEWAQAERALTRRERKRKAEFVALFASVLEDIATNHLDPSELEKLQARLIATELWRYARITEDREELDALNGGKLDRHQLRRRAFKDFDERYRLRNIVAASVAQTRDLFGTLIRETREYIPAEPSEDVIPMRGRRRG